MGADIPDMGIATVTVTSMIGFFRDVDWKRRLSSRCGILSLRKASTHSTAANALMQLTTPG